MTKEIKVEQSSSKNSYFFTLTFPEPIYSLRHIYHLPHNIPKYLEERRDFVISEKIADAPQSLILEIISPPKHLVKIVREFDFSSFARIGTLTVSDEDYKTLRQLIDLHFHHITWKDFPHSKRFYLRRLKNDIVSFRQEIELVWIAHHLGT